MADIAPGSIPDAVSRFRVVSGEGDGAISVQSDRGHAFPLRKSGLFLHLTLEPGTIGRALLPASLGDRAWIVLRVVTLAIGHKGDEGWRSVLGDDSIFVIDESKLRRLHVNEVRVVSMADFSRLQDERSDGGGPPDASQAGKAPALLSHLVADGRGRPEMLTMTLGLPDEQFTALSEACLNGHVQQIYAHGITGALSTAAQFETARDMVLRPGDKAWVDVDAFDITATMNHPKHDGAAGVDVRPDDDQPG